METHQSKVYFLNVHLNKKLTGVEQASLLRAKIFHEYLQITPTIVTVRYNHQFRRVCQNHIAEGTLHPKLPLLNMYEDLQGTMLGTKQKEFQKAEHFTYKKGQNTNDYRVYCDDKLIQYVKRFEDGTIDYINFVSNGKKIGRYKYDMNGYLSVYQVLDSETQRVLQEDFYHVDGTIRLKKYFRTVNQKHLLQSIVLFDKNGTVKNVFQSEDALIGYWLEYLFDEEVIYYCFIDKNRIYYPHLMKQLPSSNVKIIPCIHAMHTRSHTEVLKSGINRNYHEIFEDVTKPDAIVMLTEQQKEDIATRFGEQGNYHVIPHTISQMPEEIQWTKRDPYKVVALCRYSKEKQLDQMIRIFASVVEQVPKATLEIYGFGSERGKLLKLIQELEMSQHIFLKGYVDDISVVYHSASLSLLTSYTEAFSLSTMESLAHGCPVVSYDIKYGPSDMIFNGENGFLMPLDDQDQYAEKVSELLRTPCKLKKMSEAAYRYREAYAVQDISEKWQQLLQDIT